MITFRNSVAPRCVANTAKAWTLPEDCALSKVSIDSTMMRVCAQKARSRNPESRSQKRGSQFRGSTLLARSLFFKIFPLAVLLLFLYPKYVALQIGPLGLNPFKLLTLLLYPFVMIWVIFLNKSLRATVGIVLFSTFWLLRLVSDILGDNTYYSVQSTLRDFIYGGIYFYAALAYFDQRHAIIEQSFRSAITWGVGLVALAALWEHYGRNYLSRELISGMSLQLNEAYQRTLEIIKLRDGFFRSQAFYTHPIVLGQFSVIAVGIGTIFMFQINTKLRGTIILALALIIAWSTGSRSAYLASLAVVSVFFMSTSLRHSLRAATSIWLGMLTAIYFGDQISDLLAGLLGGRTRTEISSSLARQQMWVGGWDALDVRPFFGFGSGQSVFHAGFFSYEHNIWTVDDMFLTFLVDYGIAGASIFLVIISLAVLFGIPSASRQDRGLGDQVRTVALIGLAGLLVSFKATSIPEALPWVYLFLGMLYARPLRAVASRTKGRQPAPLRQRHNF